MQLLKIKTIGHGYVGMAHISIPLFVVFLNAYAAML